MKIESQLLESINLLQLFKYVSVGVIVNGAGYALFILFLFFGMDDKVSASITYVVGVLASFLLNRKLVFESSVTLRSGLLRLFTMLVSGYALNIGMLYLGVDILSFPAIGVQLVSIFCVSIFFYCVNKLFVHRSHA